MSKHRLTYLKHVHWLFKNKAVVREADVILVSCSPGILQGLGNFYSVKALTIKVNLRVWIQRHGKPFPHLPSSHPSLQSLHLCPTYICSSRLEKLCILSYVSSGLWVLQRIWGIPKLGKKQQDFSLFRTSVWLI